MSGLCTRCALCCDGALFDSVPLRPAEATNLRHAGLALVRDDALPQPCAALAGGRCTIYAHRPNTCRSYRCMLLLALDAGEVSEAEADAVVAEARARLAALAADLPGDGSVLTRARAAARAGHLSPETHARLDRAVAFLDRRFRGHVRR